MKTLFKYLAFARLGARQTLLERGELLGRAAFFALILGVFSALWKALERLPFAGDTGNMLWYLATTEWILLSTPHLHVEIQQEVRSGDFAVRASRPISYLGATLAKGLGSLLVRAATLGPVACVAAFLFSGTLPEPFALAKASLLGFLGSALLTCFHLLLGVFAFWLNDVSPLYWVWQKALFVLGGLTLPLGLYPSWLQFAAQLTPFPWALGFPAGLLLGHPTVDAAWILLQLFGWATFTLMFVAWLFRRARASVSLQGG